eukprot:TRINITY_DN3_c1_g1_i1.p4 TRINITY_DN3_c1_g1~~TRINITY_DN3_c1_g1_i1.p4  ORF type:complete len:526 (-),score=81.73 TRINITY_DN3_c1_g1_i1:20779-22356(-)
MLKGSHFEVTSPTPDSPLPEDLERFPESFSPLERQTANFTYHLTDGNIATPILEEIGCESRTDDREELITIIVEIGDGREETIVVHNGDKADELAERFAMKHHLSEAMKEKLKENIQANIDEVIREMDAEEQLQEIEEMDKNPENVPEDDPEPQSEASNTGFMAKNMSQKAGNTQKSSPERKTVGSISSPKEIEVQDLTPTKGSRSALERIGLSKTPKPQNYGHKLYEKAMKVKEEREKKHEQIRKEKELEVPQWSFKPSINPVSRSMTKQAGSQSKLEDRLLQEGRRIQEKREQIKTNMTVEEQMNCPFKPEVNKNSMKLADDRSRMVSAIHSSMSVSSWGDKFEFLFEDAKRRQSHKSRLGKIVPDEECTFHPSIEISQRATVGSSSSKKLLPKNLRIEDTKVDKTTGQLLYRPKTGRAPITGRNQGKIPIGEYLYFQSKKKEKFIKALEKEESLKEKELHSKSHIQGTSKKIAENRKIGSIINIFNTLDQDSDGLISAKTVCITSKPFPTNCMQKQNCPRKY